MIFLALYLVGYFISFGLCLGVFEKRDFSAYMASFYISFLSWINIGLALADIVAPEGKKIKD